MRENLLYPPNGGDPVKAHPSKVDEMKSAGWLEAPAKSTKTKEVNEDE
jgi:hypothetical protein